MASTEEPESVRVAVTVLGILAFVAGLTRAWIIDPVASAFDSLSADGKVIVVAILVTATIGGIGAIRLRRRRTVEDTARRIASHEAT